MNSSRPRKLAALALMVFFLFACGGSGIPDTIPPTIASTSPVAGASTVAVDALLSATFSEAMSASTISATTFTLNNGSANVAGTVTYTGTTASFTPSGPLAYATQYTATITSAVKDLAGNAMAGNASWSFTTRTSPNTVRVLFLHHSTGGVIWSGNGTHTIPGDLAAYNSAHGTHYEITELAYPDSPYPWDNYPYDYWKLWVDSPGTGSQPTLASFVQNYDVIVFKHCFPVSNIGANSGTASVSSSTKSLQNYYLQYAALKEKLRQYPNKKFIAWTGAALLKDDTSEENATRAQTFFNWVKTTWDQPGDNIFVWDFFALETDNGMYLTTANASSSSDSHPNSTFAGRVAPLFVKRLVDVIEGRGDSGSVTGQ